MTELMFSEKARNLSVLRSMLTFAPAFVSISNMVSMQMLTTITVLRVFNDMRKGIEPTISLCVLLPLLLLFSKTRKLSVNGPSYLWTGN